MAGMSTSTIDRESLVTEAEKIIARAEQQKRDLSDFEAGRIDVLLEIAARHQKSFQSDGLRSTERGKR
jgi:hypothetical protein